MLLSRWSIKVVLELVLPCSQSLVIGEMRVSLELCYYCALHEFGKINWCLVSRVGN